MSPPSPSLCPIMLYVSRIRRDIRSAPFWRPPLDVVVCCDFRVPFLVSFGSNGLAMHRRSEKRVPSKSGPESILDMTRHPVRQPSNRFVLARLLHDRGMIFPRHRQPRHRRTHAAAGRALSRGTRHDPAAHPLRPELAFARFAQKVKDNSY